MSLRKDRRNTYGNNDKAARKAIPLRKALENRKNRHKNNQAIAAIENVDDAKADLVESSARQDVYRTGGWTKGADEPLGKVVAIKLRNRVDRPVFSQFKRLRVTSPEYLALRDGLVHKDDKA